MKKTKPKFDISVQLLLVAAIFIVAFFLWYFFIYVNSQERMEVQKDFRALTQIAQNFKGRYESYISIIKSDNFQERLREETQELADKIKILKKQTDALNGMRSQFGPLLENIYQYREINNTLALYPRIDSLKELVKNYKTLRQKNGFIDSIGTQQLFDQVNSTIRGNFAGLELSDNSPDKSYIYFGSGDFLIDTTGLPTREEVLYGMKKSTFFKPIERTDIFEEFLIIKGNKKNELFYSSFPGDFEISALDSLIKSSGEITSGNIADAKISGIDYKLFFTSLYLENGNKYFIGGLINKDKYIKEIRSINYFLALIIVIVFIIFLLSIPLFKIKMTGESQQFKITDLALSTLSVILGTSFIVLVILSILGYSRTMNKVDQSLKDLSCKVKKNFVGEIETIERTLDEFISDSLIVKLKFDTTDSPRIKLVNLSNSDTIQLSDSSHIDLYNSTSFNMNDTAYTNNSGIFNPNNVIFIKSNNTNFVRYIISDSSYFNDNTNKLLNNSVYILLNDSIYHYFKLIFILDSKGNQDTNIIISSRRTEEKGENYNYRDYFKKSGEWELNGKKLMIDFIFSSTSGEQLGVVSKRRGNKVYVITSRLYSVINTIMPPGYGFCIIDKKGDVKFDSDPEKMLRENFLDETENSDQLLSAIYADEKTLFTGKYLGKSHSFYIQPIENLPLYLVTFYDNTYSNSVNTQVTGNVVLFSVTLLIMFFILLIGFRFIHYRKSGLKKSFDIVKFLRPDKHKSPIYYRMVACNIVAVILIIVSFWLTNASTLIYLIYLYIAIQLIVINFRIEYETRNELKNKQYSYRYLILAGIIIILIFYLAIKVKADIYYLTGFAVILLAADYYILLKSKEILPQRYLLYFDKSDPKLFYTYLFSWLCLIVVIPIIVFFTVFYNYETELDLTHTLYSYAKDEAERTYDIDKFYHDNMKESFLFFRSDRETKGIYLLNHTARFRGEIDTTLINNNPSVCGTKDSVDDRHINKLKYCITKVINDTICSNSLNNIFFYYQASVDPLSRERKSLIQQDFSGVIIETSGQAYVNYRMRQIYYSAAGDSPNIYYLGIGYNFGFNKWEVFILSVIAFLSILFTIWKLIQFICERMFDLSIKEERNFEDLLNYHIELGNNIIIFSPTSSEVLIKIDKPGFSPRFLDYRKTEPEEYVSKAENVDKVAIINLDLDPEYPERDVEKLSEIIKIGERKDSQMFLVINKGIEKLIELNKAKIEAEKNDYELQSLKKLQSKLELLDKNYDHVYAPLLGAEDKQIKKMINSLSEETRKKYANLSEKIKKAIINELTVLGILDKDTNKDVNQIRETIINELAVMGTMNMAVKKNAKKIKAKIVSLPEDAIKKYANLSEEIKKTIINELAVLDLPRETLKNYADKIISYADENAESDTICELIILRVQEIAKNYYESIWSSCTNEEKLVLDDISENLLLNNKNERVIKILMAKGFLKKNVSICIVNDSFRNFVNTKGESDLEKEYLETRKSGNWAKYRAPLLLILAAIAFFIVLQENVFPNIYSMLTVMLGIITAIGKISGLFSSGGITKSANAES